MTGDRHSNDSAAIVVLGIGNLLWADEGFGVRCVQALEQRYQWPAHVSLVDGGTQGLNLLRHVQAAQRLLIFDAIDYDLAPGSLHLVRDAEVPSFLGAKKLSLHQTGFQEVLALAQLLGAYPEQLLLVGCQPQTLDDFGGSLTAVVRASVEPALQLGLAELARWGVTPKTPARQLQTEQPIRAALDMQRYEAERPDAQSAERAGDSRFMRRAERHPPQQER